MCLVFFLPPKFPQRSASLSLAAVECERVIFFFCSRDENNSIFFVSTQVSNRKSVDSVPAIELKPHRMISSSNGLVVCRRLRRLPTCGIHDNNVEGRNSSFCTYQ